jgi:Helix-turn-helix
MNPFMNGDKSLKDGIRRMHREVREDTDLTQDEVAKRLRLSRNIVANMENGRRPTRGRAYQAPHRDRRGSCTSRNGNGGAFTQEAP